MTLIFHLHGYKIMSLVFPPLIKGLMSSHFYMCYIEHSGMDKSTNMSIGCWNLYDLHPSWGPAILTICCSAAETFVLSLLPWSRLVSIGHLFLLRSFACFLLLLLRWKVSQHAEEADKRATTSVQQQRHTVRVIHLTLLLLLTIGGKNVFIKWMFQRLRHVTPPPRPPSPGSTTTPE